MNNNLRVLYLKKAVEISRSKLWNSSHEKNALGDPSSGNPWLAFGEFDLIISYKSQFQSLFTHVSEHNSKLALLRETGVYSQAMYLLPCDSNEDAEDDFWDKNEDWFIGIVRLHLIPSSGIHANNKALESIKRTLDGCSIAYTLYKTIELGDLVVVVKSNLIKNVLFTPVELNKNIYVAKSYTYCGINLDFLKNENSIITNSQIPYISMQFSRNKTMNVAEALSLLESSMGSFEQFAVTGRQDFLASWSNISTTKLIETFRKWILCDQATEYKKFNQLNMVTELGVKTKISDWQTGTGNNNAPVKLCDNLSDSLKRIDKNKCQWQQYFNRLVSTMKYIASTSELDEIIYLIYPSAKTLIDNLIIQKANANEENKVYAYIESWSQLIDTVMQSEGHMMQMPEIHPTVMDVPPVFLEYIQAFLNKCKKLLRVVNGKHDDVEFLLIPKLCDCIEANELFDIFEYETGLVLIDIPFTMFSHLKQIQIALCHETSHFVGDFYRKRAERYSYFLQAAAIIIAQNIFTSYNPALQKEIAKGLKEKCDAFLARNCKSINDVPLKMIKNEIVDWTFSLFEKENAAEYAKFIKAVLSNDLYAKGTKIAPITNYQHIVDTLEYRVSPLIEDMYHLFRECFADLCAIYLLNLSEVEYYQSIKAEIILPNDIQLQRVAIRIAVCLAASGKHVIRISNNDRVDTLLSKLTNQFYIQCVCPQKEEPVGQIFPLSAIYRLFMYLHECFNELQKIDRTEISIFQPDIPSEGIENWNLFFKAIEKYREELN